MSSVMVILSSQFSIVLYILMVLLLEEVHGGIGDDIVTSSEYWDRDLSSSVYGVHRHINAPRKEGFTEKFRPSSSPPSSTKWISQSQRNRMRNRRRNTLELALKDHHQKRNPFNEGGSSSLATDLISQIDSCCPTEHEVIEPIAGRNRSGHFVELYRDSGLRQRFYEVSCHPKILNKPCKFLDGSLVRVSQCVQQHSLTYALVRPPSLSDHDEEERSWSLDYITIRNGCTCQVVNVRKNSGGGKKNKRRQ